MNEEGIPPRAAISFAGGPARSGISGDSVRRGHFGNWPAGLARRRRRRARPNPTAPRTSPAVAVLDIAVLVFREGLECVLVLSAITASMVGRK